MKLKVTFKPILDTGKNIVFLSYNDTGLYSVHEISDSIHFFESKVKVGNSHSTMIGYSSGGILAKRSLNFLDESDYNHNFYNYISIDTPKK